jgi:prepilin-type N-terminal cleavage/methylation domain-containing protein
MNDFLSRLLRLSRCHTHRQRQPDWARKNGARRGRRRAQARGTEQGLTLVETLVVIVIAGILVTIVAVGGLGLWTANTLNAAQDEVLQAMRQAQLQAVNTRQTWRVGFREVSSQVEWITYAAPAWPNAPSWQALTSGVRIASKETTLSQQDKIYFVEFDHKGNVTPPFGRLSLTSNWGGRSRRCVFVSTLLGAMRKASDGQCY